MTPALDVLDVTLVHRDGDDVVHALDHVSLRVERGEMVAVIGPSGSGKSSLLAVAGALVQPDSGVVRVDDQELTAATARTRSRIRRERIGFVFQSGNLVPALTCVDQVRLPLTFGGVADPRDPVEQDLAQDVLVALAHAHHGLSILGREAADLHVGDEDVLRLGGVIANVEVDEGG